MIGDEHVAMTRWFGQALGYTSAAMLTVSASDNSQARCRLRLPGRSLLECTPGQPAAPCCCASHQGLPAAPPLAPGPAPQAAKTNLLKTSAACWAVSAATHVANVQLGVGEARGEGWGRWRLLARLRLPAPARSCHPCCPAPCCPAPQRAAT